MNIDFKILWFEDDKDWYDSILPVVESYLSENGFNFIPERCPSGENLEEDLNKGDYDLFLVDFNMPGEHGNKIIERLRRFELYTDIVFYSQNGEDKVRESLQQKAVEGVYCSGRNREDFEEKVTNVIKSNIKKVLDLNNMRGIVIAKAASLDLIMDEIIIKKIASAEEKEAHEIKKLALKKVVKSLQDRLDYAEKHDIENDFEAFIRKQESFTRWRLVKNICNRTKNLKEFEEIISDYDAEIISVRNKMAHLKEEIDDNGIKSLKSSYNNSDFVFNDAKSIEVRSNIQKYDETFSTILERL